ncbi:MAG: RNA polymerase recycling motor ATPase HelR [Sporichthyaceae bacterium]
MAHSRRLTRGILLTVFDLPANLAAKADPALIAADERHFAAIAASLEDSIADLAGRLEAELAKPIVKGQAALNRDLEVYRLTARLRTLRRYGLDLCLGRMVAENDETTYVGRLGLTDAAGTRLLIDWRTPAAEPFFGATHANPMGLASRRRYRWAAGAIVDYWDEVFATDALAGHAALDDQSAFIASLAGSRTERMRDVLATIAADQDAIIRAGSRGALVVDGGPGTGKTVVALHRAAYLLYSDPRLEQRRGGVLVVGPSRPYLDYVSDVLPSLGEEGVRTCVLRDLLPEGPDAEAEADPEVARLKATGDLGKAIDAAVALYEDPPTTPMVVETDWADVRLRAEDWADVFDAPAPGTPHNDAREQIWDELVARISERVQQHLDDTWTEEGEDDEKPFSPALLLRSLRKNTDLVTTLHRAWPLLEPNDIVTDLWAVPAYLKKCAPWLSAEERAVLKRDEGSPWTVADLPWLDAARQRLGDPLAAQHNARRTVVTEFAREEMAKVVDDIIAADDDGEGAVTMLHGDDLRGALVDERGVAAADPDTLAGPFAHIVVDEAQELTDAQWQMLLARCPSRSFTIVGDRAQARHGFTESWHERLKRIGLERVELASLTVNYRTPQEIMAEAEPVIRAAIPDANVPTSIRSSGIEVRYESTTERDTILAGWLADHPEGIACVIGDPDFPARPRVRSLSAAESKGLEFDLVVLVDPDAFGDGIEGAVDRYVAMTRATRQLVVLTRGQPGSRFSPSKMPSASQ